MYWHRRRAVDGRSGSPWAGVSRSGIRRSWPRRAVTTTWLSGPSVRVLPIAQLRVLLPPWAVVPGRLVIPRACTTHPWY